MPVGYLTYKILNTQMDIFLIWREELSWKFSIQTLLTRSNMESEFVSLDKCGKVVEWLNNFSEDIPEWSKLVPTICIYYDNQATIGSVLYNSKSRHMCRQHNTVK